MKIKLLTCALLLASFALMAQEKKKATVHIKKVENINGVEKVTDTTYTTDDVSGFKYSYSDDKIITEDIRNENGKEVRTIMIDDHNGKGEPTIKVHTGDPKKDAQIEKELREAHKKGDKKSKVIVMDENGKTTTKVIEGVDMEKALQEAHKALQEAEKELKNSNKQIKRSEKEMLASEEAMKEAEKALLEAEKEMQKNGEGKHMKKVIIVNDEESNDGKGGKTITRIVMLNMNITDASDEDVKRLGAGSVDNKVEVDNMKLYPNPNDGKFNLNFNLKNKGDVEVTVYNVEGKQVYNEKIPNFEGEYNKPIDISRNAKGIYFVKIQQGKHTQVKKISLD